MDTTIKTGLFMLLALVVGGLAPVQGSLNAQMGQLLGHPLRGTLMNFLVGGGILVGLLMPFVGFPAWADLKIAPWYLFTAGLIGVMFVTVFLGLIPEIGALRVVAAVVVGQLVVSAVIDHFGILNVTVVPMSINRIIGMGLLLVGLYMIQRS
ncbi:DMT family transporter [bacterium]|nr:DMT family transporter [bacterium]